MYAAKKSFVYPSVVVYIKQNGVGFNRIGITVSKKIGCAVKRNRAKRVILEAFRQTENLLTAKGKTYDIVFVARGRTARCKMNEVAEYLKKAFNSVNADNGANKKQLKNK